MITILGAGGAIGGELAKLLASRFLAIGALGGGAALLLEPRGEILPLPLSPRSPGHPSPTTPCRARSCFSSSSSDHSPLRS